MGVARNLFLVLTLGLFICSVVSATVKNPGDGIPDGLDEQSFSEAFASSDRVVMESASVNQISASWFGFMRSSNTSLYICDHHRPTSCRFVSLIMAPTVDVAPIRFNDTVFAWVSSGNAVYYCRPRDSGRNYRVPKGCDLVDNLSAVKSGGYTKIGAAHRADSTEAWVAIGNRHSSKDIVYLCSKSQCERVGHVDGKVLDMDVNNSDHRGTLFAWVRTGKTIYLCTDIEPKCNRIGSLTPGAPGIDVE